MPPYAHHLNLAMQTLATIVLWAGTAGTLAWAAVIGRRERTILPVTLVLAVAVGSILEPIYDNAFHLFWYTGGTVNGDITGHQWTLFTAFGLPQPVWVMPAYVMVFGLPALVMYRKLAANPTPALIAKMAVVMVVLVAAFETTANNIDLYGYYGDAPVRLLKYPVWIAFMESAQITGLACLTAALSRRKTSEAHALAMFALFPANFGFDVIGAGFPTLIAMNVAKPSTAVMTLTVFASVALAATSLWWTGKLLLSLGPEPAVEPAGQSVPQRARQVLSPA